MNRIDNAFKKLKASRRKAFIAYITAGDPDLATTGKLVLSLERAGADLIELGIPFSDPIADGPTIQAASHRALLKKTTLSSVLDLVKRLRINTGIPIVFMTYYNPVLKYGLTSFFERCKNSGVDGVIVPDLPVEESDELARLGKKAGVRTIFLVAPTSTKKRVKDIVKKSAGFVYYVSSTGVTGARKNLPADMVKNIRFIKSMTSKPVAVGFGVSDQKQAKLVARTADGVIVGSAIVKIIAGKKNPVPAATFFAKKLAGAIHDEK